MTYPLMALIAALLISLAGNGLLGRLYMNARDDVTEAEMMEEQARGAADTCSKSIEQLTKAAAEQQAAAREALKVARDEANKRSTRADTILRTPATTPGNDCKSAADRAAVWLRDRK